MRPPELRLFDDEIIVDSFAGGGGASLGIEMALGRSPDIAINHDAEAIAMHAVNHPRTKHYCESVWKVDPKKAVAGRRVGLAWFSPDCKHFSKAKGGKPVEKKIRGLAWVVIRWAQAVRPRVICLENVEEFRTWGPLLADGRPDRAKTGRTFKAWCAKLRKLGYVVDWRELRASDYGAPTSRKRLFMIARCDGQPIVWPAPTHGKHLLPYRTAAECITWELPCPSIFERARPLAEATLRRIARGVKRYVIDAAEPFLVPVKTWGGGGNEPRSLEEPMRTVTASKRGEFAVVEPFVVPITHEGDDRIRSAGDPLPTVTGANRGEQAIVAPTIARIGQVNGNGKYCNDIEDPLTTITSKAEHLLVAPSLIQTSWGEREGQAPRCLDIEKPLGTVVGGGIKQALVAAFLAKHYGGPNGHQNDGAQMRLPVSTVTTQDHNSLVASSLVKFRGTSPKQIDGSGAPMDGQVPTISGGGIHVAEVRAFLTAYYGTEQDAQLRLPAPTVTTKDRFALVTVAGEVYAIADIGMRMLVPRELFRAQGFPDRYVIDPPVNGKPLTKTAQVRMAGNSVCPPIAAAIIRANLVESAARESA